MKLKIFKHFKNWKRRKFETQIFNFASYHLKWIYRPGRVSDLREQFSQIQVGSNPAQDYNINRWRLWKCCKEAFTIKCTLIQINLVVKHIELYISLNSRVSNKRIGNTFAPKWLRKLEFFCYKIQIFLRMNCLKRVLTFSC